MLLADIFPDAFLPVLFEQHHYENQLCSASQELGRWVSSIQSEVDSVCRAKNRRCLALRSEMLPRCSIQFLVQSGIFFEVLGRHIVKVFVLFWDVSVQIFLGSFLFL